MKNDNSGGGKPIRYLMWENGWREVIEGKIRVFYYER